MNRGLLLVASVIAFGCTSARGALDPDLVQVAHIGIAEAEKAGPRFIFVVPDTLPQPAREALASLRSVILRSRVAHSTAYSQLPGYFYVERFEVTGPSAVFIGVSGAVPAVPAGVIQDNCGSGPAIWLEKSGSGWVVVRRGSMNC
jgi:hypothetical protein